MTPDYDFQEQVTERMTRRLTETVTKAFMFAVFATLAIFICGEVVYHLWNWLVPALFHLSALTSLWQALGLMVLCWLLFGGLRGFGRRWPVSRGSWRGRMGQRMRERWEKMTPEEREKFRQGVRSRCGFGEPSGGTKTPA